MIEIERKFLVRDDGWKAAANAGRAIRQGYIVNADPSVRVRTKGEQGYLTIKAGKSWTARQEYEFEIPASEANEMLATLCRDAPLEKTRHELRDGAHTWEIDVFSGVNAGLVMAEVELARADERVTLPSWVGPEVTEDPRFFNAYIAQRPFRTWGLTYDELLASLAS